MKSNLCKGIFYVLVSGIIGLSIVSCDGIVLHDESIEPKAEDMGSILLREIPFPGQTNMVLNTLEEYEYIMSISTLGKSDVETPYWYNRYELIFPQEVVEAAAGNVWTRKVVFTIDENVNPNAAVIEDGAAVTRVARMHIPATETAFEMALQQLEYVSGASFAQEFVHPDPEDDIDLERWHCTEIWVEFNCTTDDEGEVDDCRFTRAVCDVWELINDGDSGSGGGSGGDNNGSDGNGGSGDNGGSSDDGQGGGTPPEGDDDDPCDHYDGDGSGSGGGMQDPDGDNGGGIFHMPECDEEEEEFILTCDNAAEVISMLTDQGIISDLEQESGFNNSDHGQRNELLQYTFIDDQGNFSNQAVALRPTDELPEGWSLQYSSCHYFGQPSRSMLNQAAFLLHTHPYVPNEEIMDLRCYDDPAIPLPDTSVENPNWRTYRAGPSISDRNNVQITSTPLITIDKSNIYVTIPDSTSNSGYIDCEL